MCKTKHHLPEVPHQHHMELDPFALTVEPRPTRQPQAPAVHKDWVRDARGPDEEVRYGSFHAAHGRASKSWVNDAPTFDYSQARDMENVYQPLIPAPDGLSVPPRPTLMQEVGLVGAMVWQRLCGHPRWLSCAIIIAAALLAAIGGMLAGAERLFT